MGVSTDSDIVKFVAHRVVEVDDLQDFFDSNDNRALIADPEGWLGGDFDDEDHMNEEVIMNGWRHSKQSIQIGKRNRIYANEWKKDDHTIYTVNESEYENIGAVELAVVADIRADIELFCQDNHLPIPFGIEADDTISQTL